MDCQQFEASSSLQFIEHQSELSSGYNPLLATDDQMEVDSVQANPREEIGMVDACSKFFMTSHIGAGCLINFKVGFMEMI